MCVRSFLKLFVCALGFGLSCSTFAQLDMELAKKKCADLGFKAGTERFGACVLQLSKPDEIKSVAGTAPISEQKKPAPSQQPAQFSATPTCVGAVATWSACIGGNGNYLGMWLNGKQNGQGTHTGPDGLKYVGEFRDGMPNGQGTMTYSNGTVYVGEFKDGRLHGQGTMTNSSGIYVGEVKEDLMDGQGTFTFANGHKYVGGYKRALFDGQGTFTFSDGRKYIGEHKDGRWNGQGAFIGADGVIKRSGLWLNGQPVN